MHSATVFDVLRTPEAANVKFRLARDRPDTIRVDATLYGLRLEVECFDDDHVEVSIFRGDEDIEGGFDCLLRLLAANPLG